MISYETRTGTVTISEAFLAKLIGNAVTSCFGVVGMIPSTRRQKLLGILGGNKSLDTGIRISGNADAINVELHIAVAYGMNIKAIAASITEKVKYVVKDATDITVNKVTVKVDGIKE